MVSRGVLYFGASCVVLLAIVPQFRAKLSPQLTYSVGKTPKYVWIADLNGDDKPDILTADFASDDVAVLLGNGDGTFQTPIMYPVGHNPTSIAVGDFNEDGHPDVAVANVLNNCGGCVESVSILFGNGNGTFQVPASGVAVNGSSAAVAASDFNSDRHVDLAVGDDSSVYILFGIGNGSFSTPVAYSAGGTTGHNIVVGDFNRDGRQDLAAANYTSANVSVLLGIAAGSFQSGVPYATGRRTHEVVIGDMNSDGVLDLVAANQGSNTISILIGNSDGTFQPAINYPAAPNPSSVAVADFDGDGRLDLAITNSGCDPQGVCNYASSNALVALNNGDGTFRPVRLYARGTGPAAIRAGDLNGDGKPDLAISCLSTNSLLVLLGNGDGSFR